MATQDRIQQWLDIAGQDINAAECMHTNGYWLYVAFLCHQAIEKVLKAYWTATRDDEPPYTHSHAKLLEGCGLMPQLDEKQLRFVALMIPMYIEARYPSYKQRVAATLSEQTSLHILDSTKEFAQWIHERLLASAKPSTSSESTSAS